MNTLKLDSKQVRMIAHRGLSGLEKENTNSAFVAAGNRAKYYGIETDVHVTADGQFIIIHDDNTKRVGIDELSVEGSTFETLRKLRLTDIDGKRGRQDLTLPTLTDYISICKKYEKKAILELKNPMSKKAIEGIVEVIRGLDYLTETVFISFAFENMVTIRELLPEQKAMFLVQKVWKESYLEDMKKYRLDLDIDYRMLTPEIVAGVHGIEQEVNVWTVNTVEDGERMVAMGVDYITTNILE